MNGSVCPYSVLAVRSEPSEKSELVTQVLFGEVFYVVERTEKWCKIRLEFDSY